MGCCISHLLCDKFNKQSNILLLGISESGKSTILYWLKNNRFVQTFPTNSFNIERIHIKCGTKLVIRDMAGNCKATRLWKYYAANTTCMVYVVDGSNSRRLDEAKRVLFDFIQISEMNNVPILILSNKSDDIDSIPTEDLIEQLNLKQLKNLGHNWLMLKCSGYTGVGIAEALKTIYILSDEFVNRKK